MHGLLTFKDKVTATLERYCKEGEKEVFNPFVLVDFKTLDIYSLQEGLNPLPDE